ncbi:MAG TPA: response regulator transcription factor [Candidatus Acetatifactor stercoripullorum]|uniref:Stage 0 sporulation protein A homolog n=1 Tax=Candidatus Acetatifactor stercoripullorum TaxID=2838414 RepID=A0A9D1UCN8_9FIRM|nr:response regulator transcription factor [Candidatus Acetatifactor stercoripullorum]HIW81751.1 response regulator transcription factor [Candidatus Acetatifactor stercoripullorum]
MRILLAEDERDLNRIIRQKLTSDGYGVDSCFDGLEALEHFRSITYDAAILDVMMPKMDGITLLKKIRQEGNQTPVLILTARDAVSDKVTGLDSGANDYLVKPFSFEELGARLRAMTRSAFGESSSVLAVADLTLDTATHEVKRAGREITLSAKEYALLEYLMYNKGVVLSREKIEDHIWNYDYEGGTNVVDVYISYLRKKIDSGHETKLIHTLRGRGYVLKEGL